MRWAQTPRMGTLLAALAGWMVLVAPWAMAAEPTAVRISGLDAEEMRQLESRGWDIARVGERTVELIARPGDLDRLRELGYTWEAVERDLISGARAGSREGNLDPQYHTYQEMWDELLALESQYPSICRFYDIGDAESRHWTWVNYDKEYDIFAVRISDHPGIDEPEPCIIYDGRHHAREPVATEITLAVANYFCQNYGIDPEITQLVNASEIWCVPMVNPDGHQWVEDVDIWWRKTLWDYDQDHMVEDYEGIDPNRNYDWHWASGSWNSETYGGPTPWSARGVAAMRDLHNLHRTAINPSYHSYGEVLLYPFGYGVLAEPATIDIAVECASRMGYSASQSTTASGSSKDWVYGSIGGTSFTVETATSFIPSGSTMEQVVAQILPGSIWLTNRLWGASIQGAVRDSVAGIPLEATIHIPEIHDVYGNGELWDMTTEASTGYFCRMRPETVESITLQVSAEGYYDKSLVVSTGGASATVVEIELAPLSLDNGILTGAVTNETAGGAAIVGAVVEVVGGPTFSTGADGSYTGYVAPGSYTVIASHPSFEPDSVENVRIIVQETTRVDFALIDNAAPEVSGTSVLANTADDVGPYPVETHITDESGLDEAVLRYRAGAGDYQDVTLAEQGGEVFAADIPGQPYTTVVQYYIYARDRGGNVATDPPGAPAEVYSFIVAPQVVILEDDIEADVSDWSHYVVTGGFADQWHLSTQRNHTSGGSQSWKCGDTGAGDYANLLDAGLETPAFTLADDARVTLWHWIEAEVSSSYPGNAYDGGLVELSIDEGPWEQITPVDGYSHIVRAGGTPGPFPVGTPIFSGSHDWEEVEFDLSGYTGTARLRFRFGSDGASGGEGWFIDDLQVTGLDLLAGVEAPPAPPAASLRCTYLACSPTPIRGGEGATVRYRLSRPAEVHLQVFDAGGRLVRELRSAEAAARAAFRWDGRDQAGSRLGSGIYLLRLNAGDRQLASRKTMLVAR